MAPLSTEKGKGYWGAVEGAEPLYNLTPTAAAFVQHPLKYRRVQVLHCSQPEEVTMHTKSRPPQSTKFGHSPNIWSCERN